MNIGISITGISHLTDSYRPYSRSYKTCYENFFSEVYNPLKRKNTITTYITTYYSSEISNILNIYNPKKFQIFNFNNSHQVQTIIKSLEQLRNENLDLVVCTRFDLAFNEGIINKLNFDLSKFNFLFKEQDYWESNKFVNDCFYVFPYTMLEDVIAACYDLLSNPPRPGLMDMHGLYVCLEKLITSANINIVSSDFMLSHENRLYTLKRL